MDYDKSITLSFFCGNTNILFYSILTELLNLTLCKSVILFKFYKFLQDLLVYSQHAIMYCISTEYFLITHLTPMPLCLVTTITHLTPF